MGNVLSRVLGDAVKLAITFTVTALGTFAGQAMYDWFLEIKEDRKQQEQEI